MKVLVPVEGSKYSMEGLKVASYYSKTGNADIYVMTVTPYVADIDLELSASERDLLLESMKKRGEDILSKALNVLKSYQAFNVRTVLSTSTSAAQEIISFAEKEKIDLIVIGSKGMGATARFFLGSVASKVVRYSPCSVHVVKEGQYSEM